MCGRFTQHYTWSELHLALSRFSDQTRNIRARYNIAPTTGIDVVRPANDSLELVTMRWGLVPKWWSKPLRDLPATFNARIETVSEKPMFRGAYRARRCIVPASGFYEWTGPQKSREPHYFSAADGSPVLRFAGLWDSWSDKATGEQVISCTVLVTSATDWMTRYHDRMPVILDSSYADAWLSGEASSADLPPASETLLREWRVSNKVNKAGVGDDDPDLIAPVS